ncbi:hypothetical protein GF343_03555 [Candidatus Woesearchaeota archaeon]|nr:hypothetical protein [Candidatus Woesearchaeota archaeon]
MKPAKKQYFHLYDAPPEKLEACTRYLKAIPRQGLVVLDNNVIPWTDSRHLKGVPGANIGHILKYNAALESNLRDFPADRVLVPKDIREEMNDGIAGVISEIQHSSGSTSLYSCLIDSYQKLEEQVNSPKRVDFEKSAEEDKVFSAMKHIIRKLVVDFPELKKEPSSGDEPDERLVAYAFAQSVLQDKKVYILSSDKDVMNIAAELYSVLTAENVVGTETITGQRLKLNNVEVMWFDPAFNLFKSAYNGKNKASAKWEPRNGYTSHDKAEFRKFVQRNLVGAETALGNGAALAALLEQEEKGAPAKTSKSKTKPEPEQPVKQEPSVLKALERIYACVGVDPEQLSVDDQDKIAEALDICSDFRAVYETCGLSVDSLDEQIMQLTEKTLPHLIETAEAEARDINNQIIELRQSPEYLRALPENPVVAEITELEKAFRSTQKKLIEYEQMQKRSSAPVDTASPVTDEASFVKALREDGAEANEDCIWASNTQIADALGWNKARVSNTVRKLESAGRLEREKRGKYTFNLLTKDILHELVSRLKTQPF